MPVSDPQQPVLRLGTAGFSESDRSEIAQVVSSREAGPQWRLAPLAAADAWLVHGASVQSLPGGDIQVEPGCSSEGPVRLRLAETKRPVAFSAPLPSGFDVLLDFNVGSRASIETVLRRIEMQLNPLRVRFEIGRQIVSRGTALRHGVFHVVDTRDAQLLAVLNFRSGLAGVLADLHPARLSTAALEKRLPGAGGIPAGFAPLTIAQFSWTYARHSAKQTLPPRYRKRPIYYRGVPRVPMDWLSDTQLLLLRELVRTPQTLKDLCEVAGVTGEQVERDLACLYFASAVTSTPAKAASRADLLIQENDDTGFSTSGGDPSTAGDVSVAVPNELATKLDDRTVPASLTGVVG